MIIIRDLWKSYGKLAVLKGLNLEIPDREILVILGRSGVGKSVLLRQILGIERPDKGYVEIDGQKVADTNLRDQSELFLSMGMLFQGAALFDSMSVGENTAFYLRQHKNPKNKQSFSNDEIKGRVEEALEMVGLKDSIHKMPSDLSGGMRKRAAIARMLVYRPKILLYDEPTAGLDPITSSQINELIVKMQQELQGTSIVVTHDMLSAFRIGDRLAFHHDGKILHAAPPQEFLKIQDPLLHSFFDNAIVTIDKLEQPSKLKSNMRTTNSA